MESATNIRSLLKNERKARRVEHSHASYSAAGILACRICHIQIKVESLWDQHLNGSHHRGMLQQRAKQQREASETAGRKRKAADSSDDEDDEGESRKKARAEPAVARRESTENGTSSELESTTAALPAVDEAEWAAFTRDVATPPPETTPAVPAALSSNATITAAPISAQELAARSREEASTQAKEKREAEIEGEKEDAARRMEEEFEEMESLEMRVRKLRERRETLRREREENGPGSLADVKEDIGTDGSKLTGTGSSNGTTDILQSGAKDGDSDDEEEEEEDEDNLDWRFLR